MAYEDGLQNVPHSWNLPFPYTSHVARMWYIAICAPPNHSLFSIALVLLCPDLALQGSTEVRSSQPQNLFPGPIVIGELGLDGQQNDGKY